jgi:LAS superfamily LD-carboxypeptidase LdcB
VDYPVQQGDTLLQLALKYGIPVSEIKKTNKLSGDTLNAGETLFLPILPEGVFKAESVGEGVVQIQEALSFLGFPVTIDGLYGFQTEKIILNLQKRQPETVPDGLYGPKTRMLLKRLLILGYRIVKNPTSVLALVNRKNALSCDYVPEDLTLPEIPFCTEEYDPKKQLRRDAASALERLYAKARQDNISIAGVSGYRSYDRQAEIFRENYAKSPANASQFSAHPGESEHQTGLAMDLSSPHVDFELEQSFGETLQGRWLALNAPAFGFVIRYPLGKEDVTGYAYEPWHIRYVGRAAARRITDAHITLEEYLAD